MGGLTGGLVSQVGESQRRPCRIDVTLASENLASLRLRPGKQGGGQVGAAQSSWGVHHGSLCIGCCWALMALLFVLGVMNLWWIALVATVVLIEKITRNDLLPKMLGVALVAWGAAVVIGLVETGVAA